MDDFELNLTLNPWKTLNDNANRSIEKHENENNIQNVYNVYNQTENRRLDTGDQLYFINAIIDLQKTCTEWLERVQNVKQKHKDLCKEHSLLCQYEKDLRSKVKEKD
jgi:hypothetical protein